jgi:hypothetical protein
VGHVYKSVFVCSIIFLVNQDRLNKISVEPGLLNKPEQKGPRFGMLGILKYKKLKIVASCLLMDQGNLKVIQNPKIQFSDQIDL